MNIEQTELFKEELRKLANDKNIINLGTVNGWGEKTIALFNALNPYIIQGSMKSREPGRRYHEVSFRIDIDGDIYTVVYDKDSGD